MPIDVAENLNIVVTEESSSLIISHNLPSCEPWFYWFLEGWGKFYFFSALSVVAVVIFGFVAVVLFAVAKSEDLQTAIPEVFKMTAGYALLVVFFTIPVIFMYLTFAALILIVVDQARNIRQMRINSDRRRSP